MKYKPYTIAKRLQGGWLNRGGFSLLETLLVLGIFALITHALTISLSHYKRIDSALRTDRSLDWQHFSVMLEEELKHFEIYEAHPTKLKICNKNNPLDISQIILKNHKIYRTPGHQPYLYQVTSWQVDYQEPCLNIVAELDNGQVFSTLIQVQARRTSHDP